MGRYLRRYPTYDELSSLMETTAERLGLTSAAAVFIRDASLKLLEAGHKSLDPRRLKRNSERSAGARKKKGLGTNLGGSFVRRTTFVNDVATAIQLTFFRRCLAAEIANEQEIGVPNPRDLRYRYLKHLVFQGLSSRSSGFAGTLGGLVYGCSSPSIVTSYDLLVQEVLNAWQINYARDGFLSSEEAVRQARVNSRREVVDRFRHLAPWQLQPLHLIDSRGLAERIHSRVTDTDRYLAARINVIEPNLLTRARHSSSAAGDLCAALNQILEEIELARNDGFRSVQGHRAQSPASEYQDMKFNNRRLLELAYRSVVQPSLKLTKTGSHYQYGLSLLLESIDEQEVLQEFADFLALSAPWGVACETAASQIAANYPASEESDAGGDAVDKAEADIKHVLLHQECLKQRPGSTIRDCFKDRRPTMWLPTLVGSNSSVNQFSPSGSAGKIAQESSSGQRQESSSWRRSLRQWSRRRRRLRPEKLIVMIDCVLRAEFEVPGSLPAKRSLHFEAKADANFIEIYGIERDEKEPVLLAGFILQPQAETKQSIRVANQAFNFDVRFDGQYDICFGYEKLQPGILKGSVGLAGSYLRDIYEWHLFWGPGVRYSLILLLIAIFVGFAYWTRVPPKLIAKIFQRETPPHQQQQTESSSPEQAPTVTTSPGESPSPQREKPSPTRPKSTPNDQPAPVPEELVIAELHLQGRVVGAPPDIRIPSRTLVLSLQFEEADQFDYRMYDATLFESQTKRVAGRWSVSSQRHGTQRSISFAVSPARLREGNYTLRVSGKNPDGSKGEEETLYINFKKTVLEK